MGILNYFFKENKPTIKDAFKEIGSAGTELFSGIISEDYLATLQGQQGIELWDKMRKSDGTIHGIIQAVKLPLLSAQWFIEPASDDKKDIEAAEFIENALFDDRDTSWQQFLNEALEFTTFGYYYFEKVFKMREDGLIGWKKFAPRIPKAHNIWEMENGKPGIQQQIKGDPTNKTKDFAPSIPWEKLIYFVYQKEGDNFEGISALRSLRALWLFKQKALNVQIVNFERFGVGFLDIELENMNAKDIALAEELGSNLRSNEGGYIIRPKGMQVGFLTPDKDIMGERLEKAITFYNKEMMRAYLASFLGLGEGSVGSFALSKDQSQFFLLSLKSIARTLTDELNKHIKELVDLNNMNVEKYPQLKVTELSDVDVEKFSGMIEKLVNTGFMSPSEKKMVDYVRDTLDLPELTEEQFQDNLDKMEK